MQDERRILHIDMDAYFASLEVQACPFLKGKPLVVGALPGYKGVVVSASYEARQFGIRAGMPVAHARHLCPSVELISCHPSLYIHTSRKLLEHLLSFTSKVEMFSIDEAFLDIADMVPPTSGKPSSLGKPSSPGKSPSLEKPSSWTEVEKVAHEIAGSVESVFNLTCSIGAGPNKLIAKMASKLKKPRGITLLSKEAFRRVFWHRSVDDLFGVGEKTSSALMIFGIEKIGELAETSVNFLRGRFGLFGEVLHAMAWGEDESQVVACHAMPAAKSLGHEHTLREDADTLEEGLSLLLSLTERVAWDLRQEGYAGRRVAIKMRYSDFSTLTRQRMLPYPSQETRDVYRTVKDLFRGNYCGGGIRLLGVTVGELMHTHGGSQLGLFPEDRRYTRYLETLDRIRDTYGRESLLPAGAMSGSDTGFSRRRSGHASEEKGLQSKRTVSTGQR